MASSPAKANVIRRLLLTVTLWLSARAPLSRWKRKPGRFISSGLAAASRRSRIRSILSVYAVGHPRGSPFRNNRSRPLCLKSRIISCHAIHYSVIQRIARGYRALFGELLRLAVEAGPVDTIAGFRAYTGVEFPSRTLQPNDGTELSGAFV